MPRAESQLQDETAVPQRMRRLTYLLFGHLLLALGAIGVVLPVLPTTVFWIGAALFYAKSSPSLYRKLTSHDRLGEPIALFVDHGVMSKPSKLAALMGMCVSGLLIMFSPLSTATTFWALIALAIAGLYVISRPTTAPTQKPRN